jgi:hypothetical protein
MDWGRGGLVAAAVAGEALYVWRVVHNYHRPPVPGDLLGITVLFAALGAVAELGKEASTLAAAVGWGLDVAAFLRLFPNGLGEQISKAAQASETATGANTAAEGGSAVGAGGSAAGAGSGGRL